MEEKNGNAYEREISITKVLEIMKRCWAYIFIITLLFSIAAAVYTTNFVESRYTSTVKFYIVSDRNNGQLGNELTAAKTLVDSYTVVLKNSDSFLQDVAEDSEVDYSISKLRSMINAASIDGTEAFYVKISDTDPQKAYAIAKAVEKFAPNEIINIVEAGSVKVLNPPKLPTTPDNPGIIQSVILGAFLGFVISALFFVLKNILDNHITTASDLEIFGIPLLGSVPTFGREDAKKKSSKKTKEVRKNG